MYKVKFTHPLNKYLGSGARHHWGSQGVSIKDTLTPTLYHPTLTWGREMIRETLNVYFVVYKKMISSMGKKKRRKIKGTGSWERDKDKILNRLSWANTIIWAKTRRDEDISEPSIGGKGISSNKVKVAEGTVHVQGQESELEIKATRRYFSMLEKCLTCWKLFSYKCSYFYWYI